MEMDSTQQQFSNIIAAVDGSDNSRRSADAAIRLAKLFSSKLTIIAVLESQGFFELDEPAMSKTVENIIKAHMDKLRQKANDFCGKLVSSAKEEGVANVEAQLLEPTSSSVVGTIVEYAEKNHADLIVVGSRGGGTFKKAILGSVSNGVVNHSHCSVLVIK